MIIKSLKIQNIAYYLYNIEKSNKIYYNKILQ